MDDDKIRRGKPSAHIKFGESTAVLAGNSLLTLGFEILSEKNFYIKDEKKNRLIKTLSLCSGHSGIAGGQQLDLSFEKKVKVLIKFLICKEKKQENYSTFAVMLLR